VLAGLALAYPSSLVAQTDVDGGAIVVTAQRRPEPAEDVPIWLTVLSGDDLERMQATSTSGLGKVVPSLTMMRTGAFTQPYLRGVGKRSTLGVENSVATYLDGVYLASSIGALLDLRGIERVEVLNGPQGTLFGRNTTGGVIQIVTRDPSTETSAETELHAGSFGYVRGDLYLTGGNETVAGNLALSLARSGGYGTNLHTGRTDLGEVGHSLAARSKWVWRPAALLTLELAGDYQDTEHDFSTTPAAGYPPIGQPRATSFRDRDQDTPTRYHFRHGGLAVRADAALGGVTLMSLSAVRRMNARYGGDLDLGPQPLWSGTPDARQDQFSQEFQVQSAATGGLRWLAGLYYIHISEAYRPTVFAYSGSYSTFLGDRTRQTVSDRGTVSSYAAYGQGTVPLDRLTDLTLGLRYTREQRTIEATGERQFATAPLVRPIPGLPLLGQPPLRNSDTIGELTWRASLDRHLSREVMGYLAASRGFQSGGWNLQTPQLPAFGPERIDDFEAGVKYLSRSGRFRADANAFYYDYSDLQVSAFTPLGSATVNATSAAIYGLGLQFDARPDGRTDLTAGLQWLHTRFGKFPNATCTDYSPAAAVPYAPVVCDVTGNRLPFAPALKLNAGVTREIGLGAMGVLRLGGNLTYSSGFFAEPDNVVRQDAYVALDASAEWRPSGGGPSVRLWVTNLTGADYAVNLTTLPTAGVLQTPNAPRQVGISVSYAL